MALTRRSVLTGLLAAPIVVRGGLVMPIKPLPPLSDGAFQFLEWQMQLSNSLPAWAEAYQRGVIETVWEIGQPYFGAHVAELRI